MDFTLSVLLGGIFLLLVFSLSFNFTSAVRLYTLDNKVERMDKRSREEADIIERRLKFVREQITQSNF